MLKNVLHRMCAMCDSAWYFYRRGFQLCVALLACRLLLAAGAPNAPGAYTFYHTADACFQTAEGVLLLTALLPVVVEERETRRR